MFLQSGGRTTEIPVNPDITQEALFQLLRKESGLGDAVKLQQYDETAGGEVDEENWMDVMGAGDLEVKDESKFRVNQVSMCILSYMHVMLMQ